MKEKLNWILCTEKDSPYFGKDYNSLLDSEKKVHDRYIQGKVSYLDSKQAFEINQRIAKQMKKFNREYIKKQKESELESRKIIFNC